MQSTMSFYVTNEIRVRLRTSLLLWCYFGSVFSISIPNVLATIFFNQLVPYRTLPSIFLFIFLLFFPLNLDIFSRESQLNMLDYLVMSSARFHTIYIARVIANALLMIIPITLGFLSIFIGQFFFTNYLDIFISTPLFLVYLLIISLFFLCWFLIAMIILSIIELKYPDSMFRVILLFCGLIITIGPLILLNEWLNASSIIIGVFLGQQLFENLFLSFIEIIISCVITQLFLSLIITRRIDLVVRKVLTIDQKMQNGKFLSKFGVYSLLEAIKFIKNTSWRKIAPYFGSVPYILLFIMVSDNSRLMESVMVVIGFHFFFILLYVLLVVFPRVTIEKEFNMEEMLLSRITVNRYFLEKVTLLLRSIFFPFMIATVAITILSWPSFFHSNLVYIFPILIIRAFYFVSVIIFIWRLFPTKNLLQSTTLSIIGLEVLGFLIIRFILPIDIVLLIYSPILSSLLISQLIADPDFAKYVSSITFSIWMNLILTIALFFATIILIKSEVRFD